MCRAQDPAISITLWAPAATPALASAAWLFEQGGLRLRWAVTVRPLPETAVAPVGRTCLQRREPEASVWFDGKAINVYPGSASESCADNRKAIYLVQPGALDSLAHELAHALGLYGALPCAHADDCPQQFRPDNLMWRANGILKNHLTRGQTENIVGRLAGKGTADPLWNGPPQAAPEFVAFQGAAAYRWPADVDSASRRRHATLTRFLKQYPRLGPLPAEEEFVARYARFYFAAGAGSGRLESAQWKRRAAA